MPLLRSLATGGTPRKANGKIDLTPRRHHGWLVVIMVFGFLFPPLAVAARFGIGKDFFINVVLTICGYLPGHGHNFFIQNIRDNTNAKRTPKWAVRYGLVDDSHAKRKVKKRQWTGRYNDTLPSRTQYDEDGNEVRYDSHHRFEDGVDPSQAGKTANARRGNGVGGGLTEEDVYYNDNASGSINSDPYSLRRSRSNLSRNDSSIGENERRQARSKSKARAVFGRKKGGDRHSKADQVMGDPWNDRDEDDDSLRRSGSRGLYDDGPEDADARYRPSATSNLNGYGSKRLPDAPSSGGQRRPVAKNDGLDHTF